MIGRTIDPRARVLAIATLWQLGALVFGCLCGRSCLAICRAHPHCWPCVGSGFFGWFALFLGKHGAILLPLALAWFGLCLRGVWKEQTAGVVGISYRIGLPLAVVFTVIFTLGALRALAMLFEPVIC